MSAPRSKTVMVGGREFVIRPLLARVARDMRNMKIEDDLEELVATCVLVLKRTSPDISGEWLFENADMAELRDVMTALSEVTAGARAQSGEGKAP